MLVLMFTTLDIDLDIAVIIAALSPSIVIIVTYYFSKKGINQRHLDNKSDLSIIKDLVNGRLIAANKRLEIADKRIEELEDQLKKEIRNNRK